MARIIAERLLTHEILSWDVPLVGTTTRELSGPGGLSGTIGPVQAALLGPDGQPILEEWTTALYHEVNGLIRCGGIVTRVEEGEEGDFEVEAPGFATYPHGIVHTAHRTPGLSAEPLTEYRYLWDHVQSYPDGNLGVTVDPLVTAKTMYEVRPGPDDTEEQVAYENPWWEFRDCGQEQDKMLDLAGADYIEHHGWNDDHTAFTHHISLGVPRLGRKRSDLRFVEGENIIEPVGLRIEGDEFAQTVVGVGRGEGSEIVHHTIAHRDHRLRRTAVVIDKAADLPMIEKKAMREYHRRSNLTNVPSVLIRDHDNARISAIEPGDDILVEARTQWFDRVRVWVRVLSIRQSIDTDDVAELRVARSDSFRY